MMKIKPLEDNYLSLVKQMEMNQYLFHLKSLLMISETSQFMTACYNISVWVDLLIWGFLVPIDGIF